MIQKIGKEIQTTSATAVAAGFSFAAALAWMDVVRWVISNVVNIKQNGGSYFLLTALFTTILSVIVIMVINRTVGPVKTQGPMYAVTR